MPYVDDNGAPAGETLFVATNCNDRWPIGFCWQDPVYLLPGISNNATVYNDYVIAHEDYNINEPEMASADRLCLDGLPPFDKDDSGNDNNVWESGDASSAPPASSTDI